MQERVALTLDTRELINSFPGEGSMFIKHRLVVGIVNHCQLAMKVEFLVGY